MQEHPDKGVDPTSGRKVARSNTLFGWNTIYGRDGDHGTPYMTRIWFGRLRMHIFHRGDADPDCHDHPWDFWTFPLTSYVEEVAYAVGGEVDKHGKMIPGSTRYVHLRNVVPAFRITFRPATHCHRVLGRYSGNTFDPRVHNIFVPCTATGFNEMRRVHGKRIEPYYDIPSEPGEKLSKIVTIVWRGGETRKWGFLKHRDGKWCWVHWKEYVFGGSKDSPCQ